MLCPGCSADVADGTEICPHCDHIIDDSFLGLDAAPHPDAVEQTTPAGGTRRDERTQIAPAPTSRPGARRTSSAGSAPRLTTPAPPSQSSVPRVPAAAPPVRAVPTPSFDEEDSSAFETQVSRAEREPREQTGISSPEEMLEEAREFFRGLSFSNRVAFLGTTLLLLSCFLPWKDTREDDEVLGFLSLGFVSFVGAAVAMTALVLRGRGTRLPTGPLVPWFVQLGALGFCALWELLYIRLSWDDRMMMAVAGNYERMVSYPTYGVFLALLFSFVALAGTLLALRERTH